jgi:predicted dehydrogenase
MEKVRIGIVGIGNMGSAHAKNIFDGKISGLELAAVCDADSTKGKWAKENLKDIPFYSDY